MAVPSLAPRLGEAIDPRIPLPDQADSSPADQALGAKLDQLLRAGRSGSDAFEQAMANAERLASAAGAPRSESWIAGQEALSAAIAARYPVTRALAEIDAVAAERVASRGGITPSDQRQIESAARALGSVDARQAARVRLVQTRLGD